MPLDQKSTVLGTYHLQRIFNPDNADVKRIQTGKVNM